MVTYKLSLFLSIFLSPAKEESTDCSTTVVEEATDRERDTDCYSEVTTSIYSQPYSVDSNEDSSTPTKFPPEEFLTPLQVTAVGKVSDVLGELDKVEAFYSNRQKIGNAHPQYRTLSFRRKVEALLLWQKVTEGLANTLSTLSLWLGVGVILPEMCRKSPQGGCSRSVSSESKTAAGPAQDGGGEEGGGEGEGGGGKKGGRLFSIGPSTEDDLQQSLTSVSLRRLMGRSQTSSSSSSSKSKGTLQRMFSSYLSVSLEGAAKGPYRSFVDRGLKRKNLSALMESVQLFIRPVQNLALAALSPTTVQDETDDSSQVVRRERG